MAPDPREAICEACRRLHARNLLAAGDGNLSVRMEAGRILMTPSGINKDRLRPGDLILLEADGTARSGSPSSEAQLHRAIYRACPEARAVTHAHPPTATAWTLARPELEALPCEALPEVLLATGGVPVAPYARPGTPELAASVMPFLPGHRLVLLARHGAVAWGETLNEACDGLERVEHVAQILLAAEALGGARPLPESELQALKNLRAGLGPRLR